jgi:hypothetical protein
MGKRIPIEIKFDKLQALTRETICREAQKLDYDGKVDIYRNRIVTLKTTAKQIISKVLEEYKQASIELFGEEDYTDQELADFNYLKSLVK